jgi:hypothetical protein
MRRLTARTPTRFCLKAAIGLITFALALASAGAASGEPEGWVKVKRPKPGSIAVQEDLGLPSLIAFEVGYPGVFSPRFLLPVAERQMVGAGPILLPGLTGLAAEYRFQLTAPKRDRFALHTGGGLVYYRISSDDRSASSAGFFLSLGTTYSTRSRFLLGGSLGLLGTTGREGDDPVESFGIHKGLSSAFVSFTIAYAL